MNSSGLQHFQDLPLQSISTEGQVPVARLTTVKAATEIFEALRRADEQSSANRARVQAMFDGAPPYDEAQLRNSGQAFRCNLNFGNAEAYLENAMSAYIDLIHSVERLVTVETAFGEQEQRREWEMAIAEELSRTFREWPRFNHAYLNLCHQFVTHGVGIAYFDDNRDWRWQSTGIGDILIPRQTPASEEEIEVACARRPLQAHQLYAKIRNPEAATAIGWNVEEVKKAILKACSGSTSFGEWEKLEAELKNNDLFNVAKSSTVKLIHIWVQEFSGKVSHYISLEDGSNTDFLLKAPNRYESMGRAFVFFPYGIGTNGTYHSIRGLGYKIYPHIQTANRLRSQMLDSAMLSSSVMLQPEDERSLEQFSFNYMGPFALLSPGMKYVERTIPNMSTATIPVLSDMTSQMNERVGQYTPSSVFAGGKERTRFEVAAHLETASKISVTALNLFYEPWDRLIRETVRRFTDVNYVADLPGGREVAIFRERCLARGVPPEAIDNLMHSRTRSVRAVGSGSQAQRMVVLQQLREFTGGFDAVGQRRVMRDQVAALVGYEHANRYVPPDEGPRLPIDAKMAQLENAQLEQGGSVDVLPSELHVVHLDEHIRLMNSRVQQVEAGELSLADGTKMVLPVFQHAAQHLEQIQGDSTIPELVANYRQQLKSFGEILNNGVKHIQKLEKEAAVQAQAEGNAQAPEASPALTPEQLSKLTEHRLKLKMMEEQHQLKLSLNLQEAEQKRQLRDADKAQELRQFLTR